MFSYNPETMKKIAEECVSELDEKMIEFIKLNLSYTSHHFGYGLYLRNKYFSRVSSECFDRDGFSSKLFIYILAELFPELGDDIDKISYMCNGRFAEVAAHYYIKNKGMPFDTFPVSGFEYEEFDDAKYDDGEFMDKYREWHNIYHTRYNNYIMPIAESLWNYELFKESAPANGLPVAIIDDFYHKCQELFSKHGVFLPVEAAYYIGNQNSVQLESGVSEQLKYFFEHHFWKSEHLPVQLFENRDFVKMMVEYNGDGLQYAPKYNDDEEIVKIAVTDSPTSLEYASARLRSDVELVKCAIGKNAEAFLYAGRKIKKDMSIIKFAIRHSKDTAILAFPFMRKFKDDDNIVKLAVKANGYNICFASRRLKDDYDIAKCALLNKREGHIFVYEYLSARLRDDKSLAMIELKSEYPDVGHFSKRLKNDNEIAEHLHKSKLKYKRGQLYYMSERIKKKYNVDD